MPCLIINNIYFNSITEAAKTLHFARGKIKFRCESLDWPEYKYTKRIIPEFKTCSKCGLTKPLSDFYKFKYSYSGKASVCKICDCKRSLKYRKENPKVIRNVHLNYWYKISLDQYNELFENQKGCCAICGKHQSQFSKSLSVDHDHVTGKIKGLLCGNCNRGLGYFMESTELLRNAFEYIIKNN
jgi:hypothetical protein